MIPKVNDRDLAKPPYFKSWRSIYLIVMLVFVVVVALLYIFTSYFS